MATIFQGALINGEHTLRDWGACITNQDVIGMPSVKTVLMEVPGRSGRIDLSEVLTGDVSYGNRELRLVLAAETNIDRWRETCDHIFNTFHGRSVTVIFDEDPGHFYVGRASVTEPSRLHTAGKMTIEVEAEPFRYDVAETVSTFETNTEAITDVLVNDRMPVSPSVEVPGACELFFDGEVFHLEEGNQSVPGFVLLEGENEIRLTGTSSVTFRYRKGCI